MAVQEKLSHAFELVGNSGFGEAKVDQKIEETEKILNAEKNDPKKLDKDQAKTLLTIDVLRIFSADKGVTGLTKALDQMEKKYAAGSLNKASQVDVDTISTELTRQANKFQAEIGGDASLIRQVGLLVKDEKWGEASNLIKEAIDDSEVNKEITLSQRNDLTEAMAALESNDVDWMRRELGSLEETRIKLYESSNGEIAEQLRRVEKIETNIARRYVQVLKEKSPQSADIDPVIKIDTSTINEKEIKEFVKSLSNYPEISVADVRRLENFQEMGFANWQELEDGIDLAKWSYGDEDKQRFVREGSAVVNHVLYLESSGQLTLKPEEHGYLVEIQRATSATKRAWAEEMLGEGEMASPTVNLTPEELKEQKTKRENLEQLVSLGNAENFSKWTREARRGDSRGGRIDLEEFGDQNAVGERLAILSKPGPDQKIRFEGGQVVWIGTADEFFEEVSGLARDVSAIVPEVNQIPFSRSPKARLYQMLMESETLPGKRGDLATAKDAVFRLYTMGYVKEALWKNGGDIENFSRAALGLLGQGGDDSVYSSLNRFHEVVKERKEDGKTGESLLNIDIRDLLDFSEKYSRLKDGKRSWLNAISGGELNRDGDATSLIQRKEFFLDYMKWVLDKQLKMKEKGMTAEAYKKKTRLIGENIKDKNFEKIFDVYGDYYTNLVKVMQSIHLRYGQVAVNQSLEAGKFEFCSPPGGEAPYKIHKNSVFKFVTRYVPNNKFGQYLDGAVDVGMISSLAYARKETLPHFCLEHSSVEANPGADKYFFGTVADENRRAKDASDFVNFWKPAMFDYDNHAENKKEIWKNVRETDDLRMIEDVAGRAREQFIKWEKEFPDRVGFINDIDYVMLSNASGHDFNRIFNENGIKEPREKFLFMIDNFGYRYLEWNGLRSKRIGDLYGKYIPKNFAPLYGAAIKLGMNATNDESINEAAVNVDAFTGSGDFIKDIDKVVEKLNKRTWSGVRLPKTSFGGGWDGVEEKGERSRVNLNGEFEPSVKGLIPGALPRTSIAGYYLRHRDPDWMRPILWEQAYERGQMKPGTFEKRMSEYKGEMYFGPKLGNSEFRLGYVLPLMPAFLIRGLFVDKWHLDIDDFWWITNKANKAAWEEFKKAMGIKI